MMTENDWQYEANLIPVEVDCSNCGTPLWLECLPSEREDIELGYRPRFCKECKKEGFRDG